MKDRGTRDTLLILKVVCTCLKTLTINASCTRSVFEIRPTEIADLLVSQVDAAISSTESQLSAFVSKFVTDQLCHAREQLERYSDR